MGGVSSSKEEVVSYRIFGRVRKSRLVRCAREAANRWEIPTLRSIWCSSYLNPLLSSPLYYKHVNRYLVFAIDEVRLRSVPELDLSVFG